MTEKSTTQTAKKVNEYSNVECPGYQHKNQFFQQIKQDNIDIATITETKKECVENDQTGDYIWFYNGVPKEKKVCAKGEVIKKKFRKYVKQ